MTDSDPGADVRLAQAVAAGDPEAARDLCELHLPRLYAYILGRSGLDPDASAEVAQETIVAALRSAQHFRGQSSLDTWLCAIARRKVADHYRRESRRPLSLDRLTLEGLALLDTRPLPEETALREETAATVHRALWRLPADQREAALRKYLDGRSVAEIAVELGRSEKAVESLLSRAREGLRKRLAAWGVGAGAHPRPSPEGCPGERRDERGHRA